MKRVYKTIDLPGKIVSLIQKELEENKELIEKTLTVSDPNSMSLTDLPRPDKDASLFVHSMQTVIDMIDPHYNGEDHTLGYTWQSANDGESYYREFDESINVLKTLLRFKKAKVVAFDYEGEPAQSKKKISYNTVPVKPEILSLIEKEVDHFSKIRDKDEITYRDYIEIKNCYPLIESIDTLFNGEVEYDEDSLDKQIISVAERWDNADYIYSEDTRASDPEEYAKAFENYYTILYSILHFGYAKVVHSTIGRCVLSNPLDEDYEDED